MARIRTIKPEFFTSEDIVALSPMARLLYIALWCESDKEGRLVWKPATFKLRYLPGDDCSAQDLCAEIVESGLVVLYGDGLAYIPRFKAHQHINPRESDSQLPEPDASATSAPRVGTRQPRDSDAQGGREGKGREGNVEEPTVLVAAASRRQPDDEPAKLGKGGYTPPPSPNAEIVELYRKHLPQLPSVEVLNDTRKRAIACRWREVCSDGKLDREAGLEWFAWYFAHVAKSKFLTGQISGKSGRVWQADFDFLMNASKFPRVVEGSYHKDAA